MSLNTISEMVESLASKKTSSVELLNDVLARIERTKSLNAFITVCRDEALEQAKNADALRASGKNLPLLGVPVAVKDMILTKDIRTTAASNILRDYVPPYDSTVVRKLKEAGAVIVGKTNLDEFAMGSSNEHSQFGAVQNPWKEGYVPGGSSGGSAAAVASRNVPIALGTDTGGSIRQPASLCGIVGMKPTYGKVSRYGVVAFASSLDQVGIFANNVRDCALGIETISGKDDRDSTSVELPEVSLDAALGKGIKGLRIGVPKEYVSSGLEPEVKASLDAALKTLEGLGAEIVEISLPHTDAAVAAYYVIAPAEASSNLARYDGIRYGTRAKDTKDLFSLYAETRSQGFGAEVKRRIMIGTYVLSSGYYDAYYRTAQCVRRKIQEDFTTAFANSCDVIAAPVSPFPAFKIGEKKEDPLQMYLTDVLTIPLNLAGLPGMSIPCGMSSDGRPIGLQLIGKAFDEATLYATASAYEGATDWHTKLPPVR